MRPIILAGSTDPFARKVYEAIGDDLRDRVRLWTQHLAEPGGLEALLDTQPAVVVLGPGLVDEVSLRFAQQIDAARAQVGVGGVQNAGTNVEAGLAASPMSRDEPVWAGDSPDATAASANTGAATPTTTLFSRQRGFMRTCGSSFSTAGIAATYLRAR